MFSDLMLNPIYELKPVLNGTKQKLELLPNYFQIPLKLR